MRRNVVRVDLRNDSGKNPVIKFCINLTLVSLGQLSIVFPHYDLVETPLTSEAPI